MCIGHCDFWHFYQNGHSLFHCTRLIRLRKMSQFSKSIPPTPHQKNVIILKAPCMVFVLAEKSTVRLNKKPVWDKYSSVRRSDAILYPLPAPCAPPLLGRRPSVGDHFAYIQQIRELEVRMKYSVSIFFVSLFSMNKHTSKREWHTKSLNKTANTSSCRSENKTDSAYVSTSSTFVALRNAPQVSR